MLETAELAFQEIRHIGEAEGPISEVTGIVHIHATALDYAVEAKTVAYQYWMRYQYTMDVGQLRAEGYPMIKGVAEFYRNFPNLKKDSDGSYHIYYVNSNEAVRGAKDTDEEISSMTAIFPTAIRASKILGTDADLRAKWQEVLDHLAPLPASDMPPGAGVGSGGVRGTADGRPVWIRGLPPIISGSGNGRPDGNTMPMWMFELYTLENSDARTTAMANATFDQYWRGGDEPARIGVLIPRHSPIAAQGAICLICRAHTNRGHPDPMRLRRRGNRQPTRFFGSDFLCLQVP